jgi:SAM-dependent methyltransferase
MVGPVYASIATIVRDIRARFAGSRVLDEHPSNGTFSCVVDTDPRFHLDALRWFAALTRVAGVSPRDLVVHAVDGSESDALDYLRARGVRVHAIQTFDPRSRHCNKVAGAVALAASGNVDGLAVLTDTDVIIAKDPRALRIPEMSIGAKIVDAPNPPLDVLAVAFEAAGLKLPRVVQADFDHSAPTIAGNGNGGIYLVPGPLLPRLASAWSRWARWLLDNGTLGAYLFFTDQVAMSMALVEEEIAPFPLGREWNFPTHVPEWVSPGAKTPGVVHYHARVEPTGLISTTREPILDEVIARANAAIAKTWHDAFPNRTFWEWRYRSNPALGSGVGSRGAPLAAKQRLLAEVVATVRPASVLDVGCGDGEAARGLLLYGYTGLDVSEEAIRLARLTRPEGTFQVGTIANRIGQADLTICLDVLIHQSSPSEYRDMVTALLRAATRVLLVSGYQRPPLSDSPMVHFHEPLSVTVKRADPRVECHALREEHEITTLAVVKPPFQQNWPAR